MRYNRKMDNETTGIFIGALMMGVIWFLSQRYGGISLEASPSFGVAGEAFKSMIVWVANVLPFTTLVSGVVVDVINQYGVKYSLPSIVALVFMAVIGLGGQFWASSIGGLNLNSEETYGSFWCTIPGLERLESPYVPTAFMGTSLIYVYFLTWAGAMGVPAGRIATMFGITLGLQLTSYLMGGCYQSYASIAGPGGLLNIVIPIGLGALVGSVTAGSAIAADKSHYNPFIPTANGATGGDENKSSPSNDKLTSGHSQPVQGGGDENTFVAELYKNGQLVTPTLAD